MQEIRLKLSQPQIDRLMFIDMRLRFIGDVRRQDVVNRFGIQTAAATRDLAIYRSETDGNVTFDSKTKSYLRSTEFKPLYPGVSAEEALAWMQKRPGHTGTVGADGSVPIEVPLVRSKMDVEQLSVISRAIRAGRAVDIQYRSLTSGLTAREVAPHALAEVGDRWHMRAFDRRNLEFRDFVIGRIVEATLSESKVADSEKSVRDIQWNNIVTLELVPHPVNVPSPDTLQAEFEMIEGVLRVQVRAALAGYLLRRMSVDCTERHRMRGPSYQWWLKNRIALHGLSNFDFAPGYLMSNLKLST